MAEHPPSTHTLYQVSTAIALVEGIYQGAVRVGTLREHGDLGLGTFENLDGEMIIVDGHFFQVVRGLRIERPDEIAPTLRKALEMQGPVLVGVPVDYRDNVRLMEIVHPGVLN